MWCGDVEASARDVRVPGLILQPLVENAVGHGLAPLPNGGSVRISARRDAQRLLLEVEDDGVGPVGPLRDLVREGHGLANVQRRLLTLYRDGAVLDVSRGPSGRGSIARLTVPSVPAPGDPP